MVQGCQHPNRMGAFLERVKYSTLFKVSAAAMAAHLAFYFIFIYENKIIDNYIEDTLLTNLLKMYVPIPVTFFISIPLLLVCAKYYYILNKRRRENGHLFFKIPDIFGKSLFLATFFCALGFAFLVNFVIFFEILFYCIPEQGLSVEQALGRVISAEGTCALQAVVIEIPIYVHIGTMPLIAIVVLYLVRRALPHGRARDL